MEDSLPPLDPAPGNSLDRTVPGIVIGRPGQELDQIAVPSLTVVATESGWTAAALQPWETRPSTPVKGLRRAFGHHLTIASILRSDDGLPGAMILESHNNQQHRRFLKTSDPYPCSELQCPHLSVVLGEAITSRVVGAQPEEDLNWFWGKFLAGNTLYNIAERHLRKARPEHDVFGNQDSGTRTLAAGIAAGHKIVSQAAREAFELFRTGQLELPGSERPPIEGAGPRSITG